MIPDSPEDRVRARVVIRGRVQGVFFRASTREDAVARDLAGSVRNLPDGSVEAVFEGPREAVEAAIAWCRRGPPMARVESIDTTWESPRGDSGFQIV